MTTYSPKHAASAAHIWIHKKTAVHSDLFLDLLSKGTCRITNPMIHCQIAEINDLVIPCPEWIPWITDLEMDSLETNATDQ